MSRMALVGLSVAASIGLCANAHAKGWHICNHTPEELDVAIAYKDKQEQWISKGWHKLHVCGGCAFVMDLSRTEYVDVYYHARNSAGQDRSATP